MGGSAGVCKSAGTEVPRRLRQAIFKNTTVRGRAQYKLLSRGIAPRARTVHGEDWAGRERIRERKREEREIGDIETTRHESFESGHAFKYISGNPSRFSPRKNLELKKLEYRYS